MQKYSEQWLASNNLITSFAFLVALVPALQNRAIMSIHVSEQGSRPPTYHSHKYITYTNTLTIHHIYKHAHISLLAEINKQITRCSLSTDVSQDMVACGQLLGRCSTAAFQTFAIVAPAPVPPRRAAESGPIPSMQWRRRESRWRHLRMAHRAWR